jgi:hypothetical protein
VIPANVPRHNERQTPRQNPPHPHDKRNPNHNKHIATNLFFFEIRYLSHNNMTNNDDFTLLGQLPAVVELALSANPFCKEPHFRDFWLAKVTSLRTLDGKRLTDEDRRQVGERASLFPRPLSNLNFARRHVFLDHSPNRAAWVGACWCWEVGAGNKDS